MNAELQLLQYLGTLPNDKSVLKAIQIYVKSFVHHRGVSAQRDVSF